MASESWNMECEGVILGVSDQEIDGALLMSLLEDTATQGEDVQEEKLGSVIRSLEAEIAKINNTNNDNIHGSSAAHHLEWNRDEDCYELMDRDVRMLENMSQGNIHEFYSFDWPAAAVYTTYSNTMELWDAADSITDHEIIVGTGEGYSQFYYGEEQHQQLYCSLWQETYDY